MEKKSKIRIKYVDLAKGLCILLIVIGHCGVPVPIPGFGLMQMPLFFILSGLFFKNYGKWVDLVVRRINTILIPFFFFYIIAYIPFYIFEYVSPGLIKTEARGLWDIVDNRQFFNGPIWFLLALFWDNLIFGAICVNIKNEWFRGLTVLIIGTFGVLLGINDIFLPCFVDVALTALPFFYFGYLLNKTGILLTNKWDKYNLIFFLIGYGLLFAITFLFEDPRISFHYNKIYGNPIWVYVGSFICVVSVLLLCKKINSVPIITYCGEYSLLILGLHHLIYRPLQLMLRRFDTLDDLVINIVVATLTILICVAFVPVFNKFFPWIMGKKMLITINNK